MTTSAPPQGPISCAACGGRVEAWESFCEGCGAELAPTVEAPQHTGSEVPVSRSTKRPPGEPAEVPAPPRRCGECGGAVDDDGYCEVCGAKAPRPRDHFEQSPAPWVGGVCDRGVRHHRNEDAMALSATGPRPGSGPDAGQSRAVLVVCDGVSSSSDSDVASLAAARAALEVLDSQRPAGMDVEASRVNAITQTLAEAVMAANDAVVRTHSADTRNPASCTFAAAVVVDDLIVHGNVGDSRIYWVADSGESRQLSVDDSVAQVRMAHGLSREEAENGPQSHAITRWLGVDAPDLVPTSGWLRAPGRGWLLVCSDGLWNYASATDAIEEVFARVLVDDPTAYTDPTRLAQRLVRWACDQGGRDNITVSLARFGEPTTGR
ncbi:hypothetical protein GCM10027418_00570 [Mariniluteicoccus endophyticus]